jgi:hypothetical protein
MEMKEKIYSLRRDLILLLLGIFLSFTTQVAYDSIREFPIFQGIPLIIRTNVLAVAFGLATVALLMYFFWNERALIKEKKIDNQKGSAQTEDKPQTKDEKIKLSNIDSSFEDLRIALMNNYNSQTITHAGYIIALTVGLLTIISRWNDLLTYFKQSLCKEVLLLLVLSGILGLICYFSLRVKYWATLSDQVMLVRFNDLNINDENPTYIAALQNNAIGKLKDAGNRSRLTFFAFLTKEQPWLILFNGSMVSAILLSIIFWKFGLF